MKTILILAGEENKHFSSSVVQILDSFNLKYKICYAEDMLNETYYDYVILNSSLNSSVIAINSSYCFVNMDQEQGRSIDIYGNIITYGFGSKSTVTVSSMEKENGEFVYCLQRYLNLNAFGMMEPQEIPISLDIYYDIDIYSYIVAITIALIEKIKAADIEYALSNKCIIKNV